MTDNHQPDQTDPVDELVQAARTDRTAFGRLFDEFFPFIFAYCTRRLVQRGCNCFGIAKTYCGPTTAGKEILGSLEVRN